MEGSMRFHDGLPQLKDSEFLADGGLETSLIFLEGIDLPCFAAFPLVLNDSGREALTRYFTPYLDEAKRRGVGFLRDTPTWRASLDWAEKIGFSRDEVLEANRRA